MLLNMLLWMLNSDLYWSVVMVDGSRCSNSEIWKTRDPLPNKCEEWFPCRFPCTFNMVFNAPCLDTTLHFPTPCSIHHSKGEVFRSGSVLQPLVTVSKSAASSAYFWIRSCTRLWTLRLYNAVAARGCYQGKHTGEYFVAAIIWYRLCQHPGLNCHTLTCSLQASDVKGCRNRLGKPNHQRSVNDQMKMASCHASTSGHNLPIHSMINIDGCVVGV